MTVLVLITTAILAALVVAFGLHQLVAFVRGDGAGRRAGDGGPRSHHFDLFDPRSRIA